MGGALGGLVVLTTAVRDSDLADVGVPTLLGVIVGSLVGLVTAIPTSVVWLLLVDRTSTTPTAARGVAAGAAAAVVLGTYGVLARSLDWFGGGCAVTAGLIAYFAGPRVGAGRTAKGR